MKCNSCGAEIPDGSRFCRECGNRVSGTGVWEATSDSNEYVPHHTKQADEVILTTPLNENQKKTVKGAGKGKKFLIWIGVLFAVALLFPAKKTGSSKNSSETLAQTPLPTNTASVPESAETSPQWYDADPVVIESASFKESTHVDGVDIFTYQVPASWRRRHDPGSEWTYYYPYEDTTKTFLQVQVSDIGINFDTVAEQAKKGLWSLLMENSLIGMSKSGELSNLVVTPYLINGKEMALVDSAYENSELNVKGSVRTAFYPSHGKCLMVSANLLDDEKQLNLDDYYAVLCSVGWLEELVSTDSIYPKSIETTYILNAAEAPDAVYNSLASENGLAGNVYCLEGTVKETLSVTHDNGVVYPTFILSTAKGDVLIGDIYTPFIEYMEAHPEEWGDNYESLHAKFTETDYSFPEIESNVKVIGCYSGFSNLYQMPSFYYGYPVYFQANNS